MSRRTNEHDAKVARDTARALRYGPRSITQAGLGLIVLAALASLSAFVPGAISPHGGVAGAYLVAPLLHVVGIAFAVAGLILSPRKVSPGVGLLANLLFMVAASQIALSISGLTQ
jgi:hypothetical protein